MVDGLLTSSPSWIELDPSLPDGMSITRAITATSPAQVGQPACIDGAATPVIWKPPHPVATASVPMSLGSAVPARHTVITDIFSTAYWCDARGREPVLSTATASPATASVQQPVSGGAD